MGGKLTVRGGRMGVEVKGRLRDDLLTPQNLKPFIKTLINTHLINIILPSSSKKKYPASKQTGSSSKHSEICQWVFNVFLFFKRSKVELINLQCPTFAFWRRGAGLSGKFQSHDTPT